jgi:amidase
MIQSARKRWRTDVPNDPLDPATTRQHRPADYTTGLAKDAMKGARIGMPSDPADPLNDCYYGKMPPSWVQVMADAIKTLEDLGAVIVRASMPTAGWMSGPGTTMAVLNRNPLSGNKAQSGGAADCLPLRTEARSQPLPERLGDQH